MAGTQVPAIRTVGPGYFRGDWIKGSDGRSLIVTSSDSGNVRLIDVERRVVLWDKMIAGASLSLNASDVQVDVSSIDLHQ